MSIFKKTLILFSWIIVIVWTFFVGENFLVGNLDSVNIIDSTFAQQNPTQTNDSYKNFQETMNKWIWIINVIIGLLTAMLTPLIMLSSWLMSPDWTSGDLFNLRGPMHNLWKVVSNIIYFVYAVLLIIVAIGTIFQNKNFSYKTMLPRILLGLILVPFTWWFVQLTISLSTNITASVLTIPKEAVEKLEENKWKQGWYEENIIPKEIDLKTYFGSGSEWNKIDCEKNQWECISIKSVFKNGWWIYGSMLVYSYGIFKLHKLKDIKTQSNIDVINNMLTLMTNWLINTIMFLIFGLLMLALLSILFVRAIWMWIYAIFSPLFTFNFVMWWSWKSDDKIDIMEFISAAFAPAIIWFVLWFGIIVITAVQWALNETGPKDNEIKGMIPWSNCYELLWIMWWWENMIYHCISNEAKDWKFETITGVKMAGMNFKYSWSQEHQKPTNQESNLPAIGSIFWNMIIQFIALVFVWLAFMAGAGRSKILRKAVAPFEKITQEVKWIWGAMAGWMPVPVFWNVKWIWKAAETIKYGMESKINDKANGSDFMAMLWKAEDEKTRRSKEEAKRSTDKITSTDKASEINGKAKEIKASFETINQFNINNTLSPKDSQRELINQVVELQSKATSKDAREAMYNVLRNEYKDFSIDKNIFLEDSNVFRSKLEIMPYTDLQKRLWLDPKENNK